MPSPALSHLIHTVAVLVLFLVFLASSQNIVVKARVDLETANVEQLLDLTVSKVIQAKSLLLKVKGNNTLVVLEIYSPLESQRYFYNVELEGTDEGVKVKVSSLNYNIVKESDAIPGVELPDDDTFNNLKNNILLNAGIYVSDGKKGYTGRGKMVIWAIEYDNKTYVGLGWVSK